VVVVCSAALADAAVRLIAAQHRAAAPIVVDVADCSLVCIPRRRPAEPLRIAVHLHQHPHVADLIAAVA
jgi:hypothetical protein